MRQVIDSDDVRYTRSHEWVMMEDLTVTVGITDYAQANLPGIDFVEMPSVGLEVNAGDEVATLETARDSAAVAAPVDGSVVEVNPLLEENPELINTDPYGDGWLFRVEMSDATTWQDLLTAEEYQDYIG
jgi:glycine cleavage system H protein